MRLGVSFILLLGLEKIMIRTIAFTLLIVPFLVMANESYREVKSLINNALPTGNYEHEFWYDAAKRLREPLKENEPWAQYYSSFLYAYGAGGFERDYEKANELAYSAAQEGFLPAMLDQARRNEWGLSGVKDFDIALKWYKKAALAGSRSAAERLEDVFSNGELGQSQDIEAAEKWRNLKAECEKP